MVYSIILLYLISYYNTVLLILSHENPQKMFRSQVLVSFYFYFMKLAL